VTDARDSRLGVALVAAGAVAWSTAGYFTRLIPVGLWPLLVWRNVFGGLFIACYLGATSPRAALASFRALRASGWIGAVVNGLSMICFLAALRHTSVANVAVIYATAPFVAAALAWLLFRDPASRRTLAAGVVALVGVAVTVGATPRLHGLTGDALALLMTLGLATFTVISRRRRDISMVSAAAASAWIGALVALPFAPTLAVSAHDLGLIALFGVTSFGLGLVLYTLGSRHVHAARTALVSTLELPLAPLWVWLAFGERPGAATVGGGSLVIAAVLANVLTGERRAPAFEPV